MDDRWGTDNTNNTEGKDAASIYIQIFFTIVRTTKSWGWAIVYSRLRSSKNAFYLYTVTNVACSSTPCNAHACLYRGCGYCLVLSVHCAMIGYTGWNSKTSSNFCAIFMDIFSNICYQIEKINVYQISNVSSLSFLFLVSNNCVVDNRNGRKIVVNSRKTRMAKTVSVSVSLFSLLQIVLSAP